MATVPFVFRPKSVFGGELDSTGQLKCRWRAVVGQQATLKADQKT